MVLGFIILITWAWKVVCAPDVFTWNLCFLFINVLQLIYLIYQRRPINFNPELEQVYHNMFKPFKVNKLLFIFNVYRMWIIIFIIIVLIKNYYIGY